MQGKHEDEFEERLLFSDEATKSTSNVRIGDGLPT